MRRKGLSIFGIGPQQSKAFVIRTSIFGRLAPTPEFCFRPPLCQPSGNATAGRVQAKDDTRGRSTKGEGEQTEKVGGDG